MRYERPNVTIGKWGLFSPNIPGYSTESQIKARFDYYGNVCAICGSPPENGRRLDRGHRISPYKSGGTNWPSNIRPLCRKCNATQRDDTK